MNTYSLTLNIAPYKKLNMEIINQLMYNWSKYNNEGWKYKNYNSMGELEQVRLLNAIMNMFIKSLKKVECSDFHYEYTEKGNTHLHCHLISNRDIEQSSTYKQLLAGINANFSSGNTYKALKIDITRVHIHKWLRYEVKDESTKWLHSITRKNFPDNEIMI